MPCSNDIFESSTAGQVEAQDQNESKQRWRITVESESTGESRTICQALSTSQLQMLEKYIRVFLSYHPPKRRLECIGPRKCKKHQPDTWKHNGARSSVPRYGTNEHGPEDHLKQPAIPPGATRFPKLERKLSDDASSSWTPRTGQSALYRSTDSVSTGSHTEFTVDGSDESGTREAPCFSDTRGSPDPIFLSVEEDSREVGTSGDGRDNTGTCQDDAVDEEKNYWILNKDTGRYFHIDQTPEGPVTVWYPKEFD